MKRYVKASTNSVSELAKFLEDSVNILLTTAFSKRRYDLDDTWAVYVGWSDAGYTDDFESVIHNEYDPSWVICTKIADMRTGAWGDYDWYRMPYNKETGKVWDTNLAISPEENYQQTAAWLLGEYDKIVEAFGNEDDDYDDEDYEYI